MTRILCSSVVRVHDSQAYRKMAVRRESISRILDEREMLPLFQTDVNLLNAAFVCAILESIPLLNAAFVCSRLESIPGLEPLSYTTEPRYLKLVAVSSFYPFTLIPLLMRLVLLRLWRLGQDAQTNLSSSSSSPAKQSISSAKQRYAIFLPPILTVPS